MTLEEEVIDLKHRIAKAMQEIEAGNMLRAYYILQGEIKRCQKCNGYLTHDHKCN